MSDKRLESVDIKLWTESLKTSVSSFFGVLSDVIHVFILVRFLDQPSLGVFFLSYGFLYLFAQIPRGIGIAVRKRASEINQSRSKYLWIGLIIITPALILVYSAFGILLPILNQYSIVQIPFSVFIALLFASTGFGTLEFSRYYMAGCSEPGLAETLRTGIAKTSMPIITVLALYHSPTIESALYAVFISYFVTSIIIFLMTPNELVKPTKEDIFDILQYSKWSLSTSILNDFYRRWDTILLGVLVGSVTLSYYDSSLRIAFLATTFAIGISKTSNVKMSGMVETGVSINSTVKKTVVASTFLIFPLLLINLFNAQYILEVLFGSDYSGGGVYLVLISIVQLFQTYRVQFESVFNSSDMPNVTTQASLLSVIFNVVTAPVLVIAFGGLGVLYSTIISESVRLTVYQIQVNELLGEYILPRGALIQFLSFGLSVGLLLIVDELFISTDLNMLITSVILGVPILYISQYALSNEVREIIQEYMNE